MGWKSYTKDVVKGMFNPMGLPAAIVPLYGDFLRGKDHIDRTRTHEAGHAVINHLMSGGLKPISLTVRPEIQHRLAGTQGMLMLENDQIDLDKLSLDEAKSMMIVAQAGRAAEILVFGTPGSGYAGDDAMSEALADHFLSHYPPEIRQQAIKDAEVAAADLLEKHRDLLDALSEALKQKHTLSLEEMEAVLGRRWTPLTAAPKPITPRLGAQPYPSDVLS